MSQPATSISADDLYEAYVYLLGRALVVRQEQTDLAEPGVEYNTIKYNPVRQADFVNPNLDVAYLEAWVAVDDETPVVLTVPQVTGRYYTAQLANEWGDVICNINERTFPETPAGDFVLHAPGAAPGEVAGVPVALHGRKAKLLARVEIGDDLDGAIALQQAFRLHSTGTPDIEPVLQLPAFDNATLMGSEIFDWGTRLIDTAPEPESSLHAMREQVATIAAAIAGFPEMRAEVEDRIRNEVVPRVLQEATTGVLEFRDGWLIVNTGGHYGDNFHVRMAQNLVGIWANDVREVVYFVGTRDARGEPYQGGQPYTLTFPADDLPANQVNAYWSVILVDVPNYRVIPNDLQRYNLNNYSPLEYEADGSLRIDIAPQPVPGRPEANWLPSPEIGLFSLTFRLYVPREAGVDGKWCPPALVPLT